MAWRYLPHDFPPYRTVYGYFAAWSKEGLFTELNYELTGLAATITDGRSSLRRPSWTRRV